MKPARAYRVTATGPAYTAGNAGQELVMTGARLKAGADAATATLREGSGSGAILAELACPAGTTDEIRVPVAFKGAVHVTLTGTGPACTVYVP